MTTLFNDLMHGLNEVEAFLDGKTEGYKVSLPSEIDVKSIRKRLNMTQASFSSAFGFSLDAVKHWEGGRRTPEASARAFLTVIARDPNAVINALHPAPANHVGHRASGKKPAAKSRISQSGKTPKRASAAL